jgi:hypothetical protein
MEPPDVDIPEPIRKNFSAKQLALVVELRNKIQDALTTPELKNWCNDACISRYLRAREWNLEAAEKMLRNTLKWREEYKPHLIRFEEVSIIRFIAQSSKITDTTVVSIVSALDTFYLSCLQLR